MMGHEGLGMFVVENFAFFLNLRAGALIICWGKFIASLYFSIVCSAIYFRNGEVMSLILVMIHATGLILSGRALWCLPIPDKFQQAITGNTNSRPILHFAVFNGAFVLLVLTGFFSSCMIAATKLAKDENFSWNPYLTTSFILIAYTGVEIHLTAVLYSYKLITGVSFDDAKSLT